MSQPKWDDQARTQAISALLMPDDPTNFMRRYGNIKLREEMGGDPAFWGSLKRWLYGIPLRGKSADQVRASTTEAMDIAALFAVSGSDSSLNHNSLCRFSKRCTGADFYVDSDCEHAAIETGVCFYWPRTWDSAPCSRVGAAARCCAPGWPAIRSESRRRVTVWLGGANARQVITIRCCRRRLRIQSLNGIRALCPVRSWLERVAAFDFPETHILDVRQG
jgi:hypothetical protein